MAHESLGKTDRQGQWLCVSKNDDQRDFLHENMVTKAPMAFESGNRCTQRQSGTVEVCRLWAQGKFRERYIGLEQVADSRASNYESSNMPA
jgi:hypothetical protein